MIGFHILKNKNGKPRSYEDALENEHDEYGITAAQLFVSGPRSRRMIQMDPIAVKKKAKELKIDLYAHNSYFGAPWSGKQDVIEYVKAQMNLCKKIGIKGFVIHLPKKPLEIVIDILPKIVHSKVPIFLEIPSVKPDKNSSETPEKINKLCEQIIENEIENVFICVDTSHIFACGYDLTTRAQSKKWLSKISNPEMIRMIHLNDSGVPLGNNKDVHAQIGKGHMWKDLDPKKSGMAPFIQFAKKNKIPIILERAGLGNEGMDGEMKIMKKFKLP